MDVRIRRVDDAAAILAAPHLFDAPPSPAATARFVREPGHHLLFAYDEQDEPVGMVSGVETTHPDKGTELFLYELGVEEHVRRRGIATALVRALGALARERGCVGMWVAVDADNDAALATYRKAAADDEAPTVCLAWEF